jgi:hypothetical protein
MEKEGLRGKVRETWKVQVIEGPGLLASHENGGLVYSVGAEQAETVELTAPVLVKKVL